jgi:hypothetical protein
MRANNGAHFGAGIPGVECFGNMGAKVRRRARGFWDGHLSSNVADDRADRPYFVGTRRFSSSLFVDRHVV